MSEQNAFFMNGIVKLKFVDFLTDFDVTSSDVHEIILEFVKIFSDVGTFVEILQTGMHA